MCACEPGFTCSRCAGTPDDPRYMEARSAAEDAQGDADRLGGRVEDSGGSDVALAVLLASRAIVAEIRVLVTLLEFARGDAR